MNIRAVIEFAKTPGRRKAANKIRGAPAAASAKKLKLAASVRHPMVRAKILINVTSQENKENALVNPLHQALLKAQKDKALDEADEPRIATPRRPLGETRAQALILTPTPVSISSVMPIAAAPLSPPLVEARPQPSPAMAQPSRPAPVVPEADLLDMNASTINSPFEVLPPTITHSANTSSHLQDLIELGVANDTPKASPTQEAQPETQPEAETQPTAVQPPPSLFKSTLEAALSSKPSSRLSHLRNRPSNKLSINGINPPARILHPAVQGLRSPTSRATPPAGSENVTPVSPPSRIPRSPKAAGKTGSAPLPPRSPSALRTNLASSTGPDGLTRTLRSNAVNPPPVPKMRSSWLTKVLAEDGAAPPKTAGPATVVQTKKVAVGAKRKSDEMEDTPAEVEVPRPSKTPKTVHPSVAQTPKLASESDFDEDEEFADEDVTSFAKLRETIGKVKEMRQLKAKSVHGNQFGVDIDITGRFPVKSPIAEPVAAVTTPIAVPTPVESQLPNSLSSRSYERLSISELISSTDSREQAKKPEQEKLKPPTSQAPPKAFKLLVDSANGSTTPPHSPPATSSSVVPPKKNQVEKTTKPTAKTVDTGFGELSQFEQLVLGVQSQPPVPAPKKVVNTVVTHTVMQKVVMPAPAPVSAPQPPSPAPVNPFDIPADFFTATKPAPVQPLSRQHTEIEERRSSTHTSSTVESYTDSLFSQPRMAETFSTQPTEYGMSQEMLAATAVQQKGKEKAQDVDDDAQDLDDDELMDIPPPRLVGQAVDDPSYMDQVRVLHDPSRNALNHCF